MRALTNQETKNTLQSTNQEAKDNIFQDINYASTNQGTKNSIALSG